jgi:acyl-CoA dehydrogenase
MQIIGARALERSLPLERWYRESRIRRVGEGPSEVQRIVVARNMLSVGSGVNPSTA